MVHGLSPSPPIVPQVESVYVRALTPVTSFLVVSRSLVVKHALAISLSELLDTPTG